MKRVNSLILVVAVLFFANAATAQGDYPPNAEPGKCYAKCMIADEYETVTEQVLTKEASVRTEAVQAVYSTESEQVLSLIHI